VLWLVQWIYEEVILLVDIPTSQRALNFGDPGLSVVSAVLDSMLIQGLQET
jgi:hypothetical protein